MNIMNDYLLRPFWFLRAKWKRYRYIKKYGITPEEAIMEYGRNIKLK